MKAKFIKTVLPALAIAFALTGCNLIEVDEAKVAREAMEALDKEFSAVAARYEGGEVTVGEMMNDFNYAYSESYYMYAYFGMDMTQDDIRSIAETTLTDFTEGEIVAMHFDEAHTLSDEDVDAIESIVAEEYGYNLTDALESVDGKDEESRQANAQLLLRQNGMDEESLRESYTNYYKRENMREILREEITDVSDEAIQSLYAEKVSENKADYVDGSAFESDMSDESVAVCWKPAGYRTVKHILLLPSDENMAAYQEAVSALEEQESALDELYVEMQLDSDLAERTPDEVQADIESTEAAVEACREEMNAAAEACLAEVQAQTDEIYLRLENGESFEALIDEFGQDSGMQSGITAEIGYCVAQNSVRWEPNFRDAAMALESIGDYTLQPVISGSGVHIIRYEADVESGETGVDAVYDALYEEALDNAKDAHAEEVIAGWISQAAPEYDVDAFLKVLYG